ncbi:oligosaccharide flippase family protein [Rhodoligotrophos defluvii]|uniref:oligosaccharide flippase family protein n=1 Tax=Rhodoligotrophos defluvii TaxID=2561934 RepID=UPI00148592DB|nr:oligosaccharide flippase family protein [Rhodoligotrophos defluvii]
MSPNRITALVEQLGIRLSLDQHALVGGALLVLLIRVVGAALAYLGMIVLIRWMGAAEFGIYSYALSWATVLGLLLPLGTNAALLRFIPEYQERRFTERLKGVVTRLRLIVTLASFAGAALGLLIVLTIGAEISAPYRVPIIISLCCVPIFALMDLHEGMARAFGWQTLAYGPPYVLQPLLMLLGTGAVAMSGIRPDAAIAMAAMLVGSVLCLGWQITSIHINLAGRLRAVKARHHTRYWMAISLPLLVMEAFRAMLENTDILLLGALAEPQAVAAYVAALRTAGLLGFLFFAVAAIAVPKIAQTHFGSGREALQRLVSASTALIFVPSLVGAGLLVVAGPWILALFSPEFTSAYAALAILVLAHLFRAATGPVEYMLNLTGHERACMPAYIAAGAFNIAANLVLIPILGLIGAAIATASAMILVQFWLACQVWRRLGIVPFIAPSLISRTTRPAVSCGLLGRGRHGEGRI